MDPGPGDVTILLGRIRSGDQDALAELIPLVYKELRRLAGHLLRAERAGHTLQPTALVHEAYLCLAGQDRANWQNRAQFMAIAAQIMRRILLQHARRRSAGKRTAPEPEKAGRWRGGRPVGRDSGGGRSAEPAQRAGAAAGADRGDAVFRRPIGGRGCRGTEHFSADGETRLGCGEGLVARRAFRRRTGVSDDTRELHSSRVRSQTRAKTASVPRLPATR